MGRAPAIQAVAQVEPFATKATTKEPALPMGTALKMEFGRKMGIVTQTIKVAPATQLAQVENMQRQVPKVAKIARKVSIKALPASRVVPKKHRAHRGREFAKKTRERAIH